MTNPLKGPPDPRASRTRVALGDPDVPYASPLIVPTAPIATVAIVDDDAPDGFVRINASDFIEGTHIRYTPPDTAAG